MAELFPRSLTTADVNVAGYKPRRGGRAVDCAGLENRKAERPREFESHPLRHLIFDFRVPIANFSKKQAMDKNCAKDSQNRRKHDIGQIMRGDIHAREADEERDRQTSQTD